MHPTFAPFTAVAPLLLLAVAPACAPVRGGPDGPSDAPLAISGGDEDAAQFALHDARIDVEGDDRIWDEGETATLTLWVTETWGQDHMAYPGLRAAADHAGVVTLDEQTNQFYGMFANQSLEVSFRWEAREVSAGDAVTLTVVMSALGCPGDPMCPDPNPLDAVVRFGAPLPEPE